MAAGCAKIPRVVVFDLDSTIWDGDIEYLSGPPFRARQGGFVDKRGEFMRVFSDVFAIMGWLQLAATMDLSKDGALEKLVEALPKQHQAKVREAWKLADGVTPPTIATVTTTDSDTDDADCSRYLTVGWASRPFETRWSPKALDILMCPGTSVSFERVARYSEIYPGNKDTHLNAIAASARCRPTDMVFYDNEQRNIITAQKLGVEAVYTPHGLTWANFVEGLIRFSRR